MSKITSSDYKFFEFVKSDIALALSLLLVGCALILVDPFRILSSTDRVAETVFFNITASDYPNQGRPKSVVVLINDSVLHRRGLSWPLEYDDYATILDRVSSFNPKSVFFDIVFLDERTDSLTAFYESLNNHSKKFPIFLASAAGSDLNKRAIRQDLLELVSSHPGLNLVDISTPIGRDEYPGYRLLGGGAKSAALALAMHDDETITSKRLPDFMTVWWPAPAENSKAHIAAFGLLRAIKLPLGELVPISVDAINWPEPVELSGVNPVPTLEADLLSRDRVKTAANIQGATVFIGTDIEMIADDIVSPIYGRIPGVYLHSIAYDNLITLNGRVFSSEPRTRVAPKLNRNLQYIMIVGCSLLATIFFRKIIKTLEGDRRTIRWALNLLHSKYLLLYIGWGVFILCIIIDVFVFRTTPGIWLGSAALFGFANIGFGLQKSVKRVLFGK